MSEPGQRSTEDFTEFVTYRSTALLRTAFLLCGGDRGAAEDLLQDVLERAYVRRSRITGELEPYIRAAMANAAANRWRRKSRRVRETALEDAPEPGTRGPESGVLAKDQVTRALAQLPAGMRAVLVLRFFDDLSEADTAAALGCGIGTVKSQTSRGLGKLRELLGKLDGPPVHTTTPVTALR